MAAGSRGVTIGASARRIGQITVSFDDLAIYHEIDGAGKLWVSAVIKWMTAGCGRSNQAKSAVIIVRRCQSYGRLRVAADVDIVALGVARTYCSGAKENIG